MKLLGYARVSTDDQAANGHGLDAQETAIRDACQRGGWGLIAIYRDEGRSANDLDRPGLHAALTRLAAGEATGLVVAKLDRLSRSVPDFGALVEWFEEADAALVALDFDLDTSTPSGRLVANLITAVAAWEREVIGARTREGLAAARASGNAISRAAVRDNPALNKRIRSMRGRGMTFQAIANKLNSDGVPTLRGGREWRPSSVQTAAGYKRGRARRRPAELPRIHAQSSSPAGGRTRAVRGDK